jgi:hypothetical protein
MTDVDPLGPLIAAAYERQIEMMLRDETIFRNFLGPTGPSVPVPWRVKHWRRARRRARALRVSFGMWIGGIEPHDCWDC